MREAIEGDSAPRTFKPVLDNQPVEAACLPENIASRGLLEKTGFKYEGVGQKLICKSTVSAGEPWCFMRTWAGDRPGQNRRAGGFLKKKKKRKTFTHRTNYETRPDIACLAFSFGL